MKHFQLAHSVATTEHAPSTREINLARANVCPDLWNGMANVSGVNVSSILARLFAL